MSGLTFCDLLGNHLLEFNKTSGGCFVGIPGCCQVGGSVVLLFRKIDLKIWTAPGLEPAAGRSKHYTLPIEE